jgi:glycyl-tRNA synthetase
MEHIYNANGLPFYNEQEIKTRRYFEESLALSVKTGLLEENAAWSFFQIEAPMLTPVELINQNYTTEDVWFQDAASGLVLRPETTPGSYAYAKHLLHHQSVRLPLCVWQSGKSYRREIEQPTKHCRFKEFYQQEFQCIYSTTTKNDYHAKIAPKIAEAIKRLLGLPTRLVDSDRLPDYSLKTLDVEVDNGDKWMEVCSISLRKDFNTGEPNKEYLVLEVAIGLDRLVYNYFL